MTDKQMRLTTTRRATHFAAAAFFLTAAGTMNAQSGSRFPAPGSQFPNAPQLQLPVLPTPPAITPNGTVVEDVIARVNERIITRSEYERAEQGILQDAAQQKLSQSELNDRLANLLRDMIDQQILLSKGKELGITGDAETMRQLDELRKQNHLDSLEALQKAAEQQGVSFEDFKQQINDRAVSQQVVRDEVGRRINMTHTQEQAYYDEHKQDFQTPEQIHLSEILIPTPENATDAQVAEAQKKADDTSAKLAAGASFSDLAKQVSGGPTATAGGDLGDFKRGTLGDVLEKATFSLPAGGVTPPIRTRQGFVILRVDQHQDAGIPPLTAVEGQVQEAIYMNQLQPALRAYLTKQRDEAYVDIKPGFVDTGSNRKESKPTFTAYQPPAPKKKVVAKQRMEQQKAIKAQAALAAARAKVAEKQAAVNAKANGTPVSGTAKHKKPHREKVRYGQAPRNSLPTGIATTDADSAPLNGVAPGVAMAPVNPITTITTGVGTENEDPLSARTQTDHKSRFSDREKQAEEDHAKAKLAKATIKATARPQAATITETQDEKHQAAPLGLNGDTTKKKRKRKKGERLERLQAKPVKPVEEPPAPVDPTVNPTLGASALPAKSDAKPKDNNPTTLAPTYAPAPGQSPAGQPIPATTSADPNAPTTTPAPH